MKVNYYTHTRRCRHAQGTERDYVFEAIKAGVSVLGFSNHAPFPDHDCGLRMSYAELDDYITAVNRLTQEYRSDITLSVCAGAVCLGSELRRGIGDYH